MAVFEDNRSVPGLLADLVHQITTLFRKETQLVRAELSENITRGVAALGGIVAGLVLLIGAINVLLGAAVSALVSFGVPAPWAAVIVAVVVGVIGFLVVRSSLNNLAPSKLAPTKSADQLSRDAALLKETVK